VAPAKHCSRQKSQTWSENISSRQTSMWQSSLYKNLFMALQVGNARGDLFLTLTQLLSKFQFSGKIFKKKKKKKTPKKKTMIRP